MTSDWYVTPRRSHRDHGQKIKKIADGYALGFGPASMPPSRTMSWPVMKEDLSEQSQRTASAISMGLPKRPIGCIARKRSISGEAPKARSAIGVSITAGQTG